MTREDILDTINELIEEEHGNAVGPEDTVISSGIDSFGITMVFVELNNKYNVYGKDEFKDIDFENITAGDIIDRVLDGSK